MNRIEEVKPGEICCNCGASIEGEHMKRKVGDFTFKAIKIDGHPLCSMPKCYDAQWDQYGGLRKACGCV